MKPCCTAVIPNFNKGKSLEEALESWKNQERKDFEIIVVDDRSMNGDAELLKGLQEENMKVIFLPSNRGPAYARHVGEREASTDIILRADSDDLALPNRVKVTMKIFEEHPETTFFHADEYNRTQEGTYLMRSGRFSLTKFFDTGMFYLAGGTVAYRKSVHQQPYDTEITSDEWMLYYNALRKGWVIRYAQVPLAVYRTSEQNIAWDWDNADSLWNKRRKYIKELAEFYYAGIHGNNYCI